MALVTCPECGRENVSDTAISCPNCGYNIKSHFDSLKKAEQKQQQQIERAQQFEALKANIELPPEPKYSFWSGFYSTHGCCLLIELIFLFICTLGGVNDDEFFIFAILFVATFVSLCLCIVESSNIYENRKQKYEEAQGDPEHYRSVEATFQQFHANENAAHPVTVLHCPVCHSVDVDKISTLDRTASIAAVGLASGKIGKQYKCRHCGHMW